MPQPKSTVIPLVVIRRCVKKEKGAILSRIVPWISGEDNSDIDRLHGDPKKWDWDILDEVAHDIGLLFQYPDSAVEEDEVCRDEFVSFLYILELDGTEAAYFDALIQAIDNPAEATDVFVGMELLMAIGKDFVGEQLTCHMIGSLLTKVAKLNIPKVIPFGMTELECYKAG